MEFRPTWLYVKKCPHCGLLYFGKTTQKDPVAYRGSGDYWVRHLNRHRVEPITLKTKLYTDPKKIKAVAERFSAEHSVADSKRWANLRDEDGIGAGGKHSQKTKRKIARTKAVSPQLWYTDGKSNLRLFAGEKPPKGFVRGRLCKKHDDAAKEKCRLASLGRVHSRATRKRQSLAAKGRPKSAAHVAASAAACRGMKWYNDGKNGYKLFPYDPKITKLGLLKGRIPRSWYNDGVNNYRLVDGDRRINKLGLVRGCCPTGKVWYTDGVKSFMLNVNDPQIKRLRLQPGRVM